MKSRTIRTVIIVALLAFTGLIWIQVYWVRNAYRQTKEQFNNRVNIALLSVANQIYRFNEDSLGQTDPVKRIMDKTYLVNINNTILPEHLENLLRIAFEKNEINLDFQCGIYDCYLDSIIWRKYSTNIGEFMPSQPTVKLQAKLSNLNKDYNNHKFIIYFPKEDGFLIGTMGIMTSSTVGVMLIMLFFGYLVFVIFKQKRLNEVKTDFINNMTHEFKTPISTIQLTAQSLLKPKIRQDAERSTKYANIIIEENKRLKTQVDQILQASLVTGRKTRMELKKLNFKELLNDVLDKMQLRFKENDVDLTTEFSAKNFTIRGDKFHLSNTLFNLIDNALKYSKPPIKITIKIQEKNHHLMLTVADNGIGIPGKEQKMIFDKFYRVPSGNIHNVKGFGLGLNYVKEVLHRHNATINLESILQKGTTFSIKFKKFA